MASDAHAMCGCEEGAARQRAVISSSKVASQNSLSSFLSLISHPHTHTPFLSISSSINPRRKFSQPRVDREHDRRGNSHNGQDNSRVSHSAAKRRPLDQPRLLQDALDQASRIGRAGGRDPGPAQGGEAADVVLGQGLAFGGLRMENG